MISVVIPLYNVEAYIENCLSSLEHQTYKDFEVIIINDGSTDTSPEIVKNYIKNSTLKVIYEDRENAGVSAARNRGMDLAQGDYVCFIDADDMITPSYLENLFAIKERTQVEVVICDRQDIDENSSFSDYPINDDHDEKVMNSLDALEQFLYRKITPGVWSMLIDLKLLKKNNLRFRDGFKYSEDIEFIYKTFNISTKIAATHQQLYLYRIRPSSAMSIVNHRRIDGKILMTELEAYFESNNPKFAAVYKKYGVARWCWATLWQIAKSSETYTQFKKNIESYEMKKNMRKLIAFPDMKVQITALIFCSFPPLYYLISKAFKSDERIYKSIGVGVKG